LSESDERLISNHGDHSSITFFPLTARRFGRTFIFFISKGVYATTARKWRGRILLISLVFSSDMAWRKRREERNYHVQGSGIQGTPSESDEFFDDTATILLLHFCPHRCVLSLLMA